MKGTAGEFRDKYRKRFRTLAVPYLIWSLGNIVFRIALAASPWARFSSMETAASYDVAWFLNRLLFSPIEYHLWFLRDLIAMVALSPLIYVGARYLSWIVLPFFFVCCLFEYHPVDLRVFVLGSNSILFFTLGAFLAMQQDGISILGKATGRRQPLIRLLDACRGWVLFVSCFVFWTTVSGGNAAATLFDGTVLPRGLSYTAHIAGLVALWRGYDLFVKGETQCAAQTQAETREKTRTKILGFTFFLYLYHEPTLDILKKIFLHVSGDSPLSREIAYWGGTAVVVVLGLTLGSLLKARTPKTYGLLTGNR